MSSPTTTRSNAMPRSSRAMMTFYEQPFAVYCQKVIIALYERGIAFDRVVVGDDISREQARGGLADGEHPRLA